MYKVTAIIPTHNRKNSLNKVLSQLKAQILISTVLEIIVVVDGSTDETLEMLKNEFPDVHIVYGDGSWWYTKSMNEGFKFAETQKPDFILTLNDDIEIKDNYIETLLKAYNSITKGSIIGSLSITNEEKPRIFFPGVHRISRSGMSIHYYIARFKVYYNSGFSGLYKTLLLPGRGILIPNNTLKTLNGFDNRFVQYASDDDFCLRALKKGIGVFISWDSVVISDYKNTSKNSTFLNTDFMTALKGFFNDKSAISLKKFIIYHYRHYNKVLLPLKLVYYILRNLFKQKL